MKKMFAVVAVTALLGGCVLTESAEDVEVTWGGRIKGDVAYNTSGVNTNGNYVITVDDTAGAKDNDTLAITPLETKIALNAKKGDALSAKVEVDFYSAAADSTGAPLPENKTTVMLRHAFVKANLTEDISILAGQTSDVFSPIAPGTLNYSVAWGIGNMGYRRPQIRFAYEGPVSVRLAAARALGSETTGNPDLQGRIGYAMKDAEDVKTLDVGISGVQGFSDANRDDLIQGGALDLAVAIGPKVSLKMEYHQGKNLSSYLGGVLQSVNAAGDEIGTSGYWLQIGAKLTDTLALNLGISSDDPEQDDLTGGLTDDIDLNESLFLNLRWQANDSFEIGFGYSYYKTTYWDGATNTEFGNDRYQLSMIMSF